MDNLSIGLPVIALIGFVSVCFGTLLMMFRREAAVVAIPVK